ncbi:glutathionylspermidine synthase family protein [Bailinhaonella thermotolerans]|uniref:Glutathionylspermidine synthase family protein n=1 Tax=Bailinhaonella thermotolerans TaxID=1070861 RepID=A0A3A3ZYI6_9ACTN|nr:glutathionylspermidine synthase family protein [Bailinhaonella thermotolerans]RJL19965.1 glutathionylspermidine synthase family protein [Bailinhaonella thermotolerans]
MRRISITPRDGWLDIVQSQGLAFAMDELPDGTRVPYWNESAAYVFTLRQIDKLEQVTEDLYGMCLQAVEYVLDRPEVFARFGLDPAARQVLLDSWRAGEPSLYGRFDLVWDGGAGEPKMLELNGDTPTSLLETAIQWLWVEDRFPGADQWNSVHDRLVRAWGDIARARDLTEVHLAYAPEGGDEEYLTAAYMADTAQEAGLRTRLIAMGDIGWDERHRRFFDATSVQIGPQVHERARRGTALEALWKLYPWEDMLAEEFGRHLAAGRRGTLFLEPAWKAVLSNKALLAVLWEMFPGHPNLLPAYLDGPRDMRDFVAKPLFGREGDGVRILRAGQEFTSPEPHCFQEHHPMPNLGGGYVVLGSWIVAGHPAGMGIREDDNAVTGLSARFVPHFIEDASAPTAEQARRWIDEDAGRAAARS